MVLTKAIQKGYAKKEPSQWPTVSGGVLDRRKYVTASEIGQCERKIKLDKLALDQLGYSPEVGTTVNPKDDWGFFERGHTMEAWAINLIHAGWNPNTGKLLHTGANQVSFVDSAQSGTPDGVVLREGKDVSVIEIKSIDPRTNRGKLPKPEHIDQVIQNADLVGQYFSLALGTSWIIYIDASNYKTMNEFRVPFDNGHAARLEDRAKRIMEAASPADLQPEGMFKAKGCDYCTHTVECAKINAEKKGLRNDEANAANKLFG